MRDARSPETVEGSTEASFASVFALGCAIGMNSVTRSYPPLASLMALLVPNHGTKVCSQRRSAVGGPGRFVTSNKKDIPSLPKRMTPHWSVFLPLKIYVDR